MKGAILLLVSFAYDNNNTNNNKKCGDLGHSIRFQWAELQEYITPAKGTDPQIESAGKHKTTTGCKSKKDEMAPSGGPRKPANCPTNSYMYDTNQKYRMWHPLKTHIQMTERENSVEDRNRRAYNSCARPADPTHKMS